jgi:hypothetical protein
MQFIFIDEIECTDKSPKFFGLGAAVFNSYSYPIYKVSFSEEFEKLKWNPSIEFKGKYLFSKAGDKSVSIDNRISFVEAITQKTNAKLNARLNFLFSFNQCGNSENNYLSLLKNLVRKIKSAKAGHKALMGYFIDVNDKIDKKNIVHCVNENSNGIVFERPFFVDSGNDTLGIITVDILNYLKSWIELNTEDDDQLKLFPDASARKLQVVKEIISNIKNITDVKR